MVGTGVDPVTSRFSRRAPYELSYPTGYPSVTGTGGSVLGGGPDGI